MNQSQYIVEIGNLPDSQLVSVWNVEQMSLRMICDKSDLAWKVPALKSELQKRGIPVQDGARIVSVA